MSLGFDSLGLLFRQSMSFFHCTSPHFGFFYSAKRLCFSSLQCFNETAKLLLPFGAVLNITFGLLSQSLKFSEAVFFLFRAKASGLFNSLFFFLRATPALLK